MSYTFTLGYDEEIDNAIFLTMVLDEFITEVNSNNKFLETISGNEITIIKGIPLRTFKFKALLTNQHDLVDDKHLFVSPIQILSKLREYKADAKELRFIILRPFIDGEGELFGGNLLVTLEEYSVNENALENGDFYINIQLREYLPIATKTTSIQVVDDEQVLIENKKRHTSKEPKKTYTISPGDTLWEIAKKEYGNGDRWIEIKEKNNIDDIYNLKVGGILKL